MLSIAFSHCYAEWHYAEWHYAECHWGECRDAQLLLCRSVSEKGKKFF